MSLTYSQYVTALSELMVVPTNDADFQAFLPNIIDYAEQRIYRDLDLLATVVRDSSSAFSANNRNFVLPNSSGTFVVTNGINVITPAGTPADSGTRHRLTPTSVDALDFMWPNSSGATLPQEFAMLTQTSILVGPWPDQAYTVEVIGTQRPTPLSSTNTSTFLSTNLPDLFLMASMIEASAYLKNFSAAADDPKMPAHYEGQYQLLFASASVEEARKKLAGSGWTSLSVGGPPAQPPRN